MSAQVKNTAPATSIRESPIWDGHPNSPSCARTGAHPLAPVRSLASTASPPLRLRREHPLPSVSGERTTLPSGLQRARPPTGPFSSSRRSPCCCCAGTLPTDTRDSAPTRGRAAPRCVVALPRAREPLLRRAATPREPQLRHAGAPPLAADLYRGSSSRHRPVRRTCELPIQRKKKDEEETMTSRSHVSLSSEIDLEASI